MLFKPVTLLDDTIKMRLIGDLLNLTFDTVMSSSPVYNLSGRYETIKQEPTSKEYNLQIDALILTNYIALSSKAFYYSPYPLLYDNKSGKEICCGSSELDSIVVLYKQWFKTIRKGGFKDYPYPLAQKKYEWFGGKVKQQMIKEYPQWDKLFDCKELN